MANADPRLLQLHGADNVLVARQAIGAGATIWVTGQRICLAAPLPIGHKLARHAIAPSAGALRYGCPTGLRPRRSPPPIAPADRPRRSPGAITRGEHVHLHTVRSGHTRSISIKGAG